MKLSRIRNTVVVLGNGDMFMNEKNDRASWLKGGDARCAVTPQHRDKPLRLVLLGAPVSVAILLVAVLLWGLFVLGYAFYYEK